MQYVHKSFLSYPKMYVWSYLKNSLNNCGTKVKNLVFQFCHKL